MEFDLTKRMTPERYEEFAGHMKRISGQIGFKVSSRGWCYLMETERIINKDEFDRVQELINTCRRKGYLPIDFVAEDKGRSFEGVETPTEESPTEYLKEKLTDPLYAHKYYTPDWFDGEEYYIQMVVEKVDLVTLFKPVCKKYHIPIANAKGWGSMLQRAIYAKRFAEAEEMGLKPVLLYCGDLDADGERISDFIKSNLADLQHIEWEDGTPGYDPEGLTVDRFGLNAEFIEQHNLTWIDNLITGSGKDLASPKHKNHFQPYVQNYIKTYGVRKCEANALVPYPAIARDYVNGVIQGYMGEDAESRFAAKRTAVFEQMKEVVEQAGLVQSIKRSLAIIDGIDEDDVDLTDYQIYDYD